MSSVLKAFKKNWLSFGKNAENLIIQITILAETINLLRN